MKNNFVIVIVLLLTIFHSCCRKSADIDFGTPNVINTITVDYKLANDTELDVNLDFHSDIADDACLVMSLVKHYRDPTEHEWFKDSMKIDGFNIRCYTPLHILNGFGTPFDYPVYIKKIFVKKNKNKENLKIVFPKNIDLMPYMSIGVAIVRYNDAIKSNIEKFPDFPSYSHILYPIKHEEIDSYQNIYFECYPDSSKTSLVFSNFAYLINMSFLEGNEAPGYYEKCPPISYKPTHYYNCGFMIFNLNQ